MLYFIIIYIVLWIANQILKYNINIRLAHLGFSPFPNLKKKKNWLIKTRSQLITKSCSTAFPAKQRGTSPWDRSSSNSFKHSLLLPYYKTNWKSFFIYMTTLHSQNTFSNFQPSFYKSNWHIASTSQISSTKPIPLPLNAPTKYSSSTLPNTSNNNNNNNKALTHSNPQMNVLYISYQSGI